MNIYDLKVKSSKGEEVKLSQFQGKTLLIVNTASQCGFTAQYEGLQKMHEKFKDRGLQILGFPCNQFGGQEPGDNQAIEDFCTGRFGVRFPIFSKVDVNGKHAEPLFVYLKNQAPGFLGTKSIKWNFTKFLVSKDGKVLKRYGSVDKPESIEQDIEAVL